MSLRIIVPIILGIILLGSCISKKEIDPKASIPKCNYRDGDNSSDKVFNEKYPGTKKVVKFTVDGVDIMDSLRNSYLDGSWIFSPPTSDFSNLCLLTTTTSRNDTIIQNFGSYAGNYIGNNYCRDRTDLVFNKYDSIVFMIGSQKIKTLPQTNFILDFRMLFWSINYLDENKSVLQSQKDGKLYEIVFIKI